MEEYTKPTPSKFDTSLTIGLYLLFIGSFLWLIGITGYIIYFQQHQISKLKEDTIASNKQGSFLAKVDYDAQKQDAKHSVQTAVLPATISYKVQKINDIVSRYSQEAKGDISIVYKNLTNDEAVSVNADKTYYMASLYKIILVLYVLDEVKQNKLALTDRIGSSSATIEFALDKIITESNNEYAQTLAKSYGWETMEQAITQKLGISFNFKDNLTISAANVERLFESIAYSLKIEDWESEYLLRLMNEQKRTHKLPKYLPKNIYSHNKTGEYEQYSHDAGIFYTPRANYVLIVMTKSSNPDVMNEHMAKLSKEIYDVVNAAN